MPKACTSLTEAQIVKINETGKSVYQFLQEAVDEKIKNDQEKIEINRYEEFLKYHLNQFDKKMEEKILKGVEIHLGERRTIEKKFDDMIEHHENSKDVMNSVLREIRTRLGGVK